MKKSFPLFRIGYLAAIGAAVPLAAHATVVELEYSAPWAGPVHAGTGPFLKATLSDVGALSTSVNFLLEPVALAANEYVNNWGFNFSGAVSGLTFLFSPPTGFDLPALQIPAGTMGGGNPPFDFSLAFSTSNAGGTGSHRFQNGESLSFTVFRSGGGLLTVDDFLETISFAGQDLVSGVFFAGGAESYHYKAGPQPPPPPPVPEPTTLAFGGLLIAGLVGAEIRRRRAAPQSGILAFPA